MEGADALDLTDLVTGCYGEGYGVAVTAEALRRIQRRDLADGLVGDDASGRTRDLTADITAPSPAELFVTRHRLALIQRVRGVAALLDRLEAGGVLTAEEVAAVAAGATPQDRMRRLLATAPAWGRRGHGQFLQAMRCLQPCLMEDLEAEEEGEELGGSGPSPPHPKAPQDLWTPPS
ncbi:apoptosis-associated speck-like protein containing a CARD [Ciconia boyciana]|uniref:apoptosis-associated speck-like protein containing a CARD n=1 Tax=Ciconia boyciana TaxID=52775 RepID=UPI003BA2938B